MRALVVGGSGQIGGWLLRVLEEREHQATGTYLSAHQPGLVPLDARRRGDAAALIREVRPDIVFYPAGFTWVDGCERDPALARTANLEQPLGIALIAADMGARFISFSTDYVFDGRFGPCDENSPTNPLSVYGQVKLDAERALTEALGDRVLTVRTSWVFGPEVQGKNFAYQVAKALGLGRTLECPSDQMSSPSYAPDVARAVVGLAEAGVSGLIHVAGPQVQVRPAFARAIARGFGLDPGLIRERRTAELGQGAPRPLNGGLLTPLLDGILPGSCRSMDEALADFKDQLDLDEGWADPRLTS